jgi:hypothetical protein
VKDENVCVKTGLLSTVKTVDSSQEGENTKRDLNLHDTQNNIPTTTYPCPPNPTLTEEQLTHSPSLTSSPNSSPLLVAVDGATCVEEMERIEVYQAVSVRMISEGLKGETDEDEEEETILSSTVETTLTEVSPVSTLSSLSTVYPVYAVSLPMDFTVHSFKSDLRPVDMEHEVGTKPDQYDITSDSNAKPDQNTTHVYAGRPDRDDVKPTGNNRSPVDDSELIDWPVQAEDIVGRSAATEKEPETSVEQKHWQEMAAITSHPTRESSYPQNCREDRESSNPSQGWEDIESSNPSQGW